MVSAQWQGYDSQVKGALAPLEEILHGPGRAADGTTNFVGALRRSMATTGYSEVKEFQRIELVIV